jgi:hypothetical protein
MAIGRNMHCAKLSDIELQFQPRNFAPRLSISEAVRMLNSKKFQAKTIEEGLPSGGTTASDNRIAFIQCPNGDVVFLGGDRFPVKTSEALSSPKFSKIELGTQKNE